MGFFQLPILHKLWNILLQREFPVKSSNSPSIENHSSQYTEDWELREEHQVSHETVMGLVPLLSSPKKPSLPSISARIISSFDY